MEQELETSGDRVLMEVLRDLPSGVAAVCGGLMSCGTCHVYLSQGSAARLPAPSAEEIQLLASLSGYQSTSRLSCQIYLEPRMPDIRLTIAPEG
jgi:2Fe-2S ferredoxin